MRPRYAPASPARLQPFASKKDIEALLGTQSGRAGYWRMCDGAQKLHALAEQSRWRSVRAGRGDQAKSLRALAELYDRQAADLELSNIA